ncbi:hypothetical protein D9M70_486790 [compost metagenome]
MLAQLCTEYRLLAHLGAVEDKGIEDFTGRTVVIAIGITAQPVLLCNLAAQRIPGLNRAARCGAGCNQVTRIARLPGKGVGTGAHIVIGMVVPTGGADTKAHFPLVRHVQFGEQVDPLGHRATDTEILIAVIEVGGAGDLRVLTFHPLTITGLEGVIETHGPPFTAIAKFESLGSRH